MRGELSGNRAIPAGNLIFYPFMRTFQFAIFVTVFLSLYGSLNFYIYTWGARLLPFSGRARLWYTLIFIALALSFIAARLLERNGLYRISFALNWIGAFWIGAMVYFFITFLVFDLLRLLYLIWPHSHLPALPGPAVLKKIGAWTSISAVCLVLAYGFINGLFVRVRTINITLPKKENGPDSLNIAMASDIHLGAIVGKRRFGRIVQKINALNPDIILLPGDILDEDLAPVVHQNLGEGLKSLRAPLGVFACTGNHEYIGGIDNAVKYLGEHGVRLLRDEVILVNGAFWLAGREDRSIAQFSGRKRKTLPEILSAVDRRHPLILMDHQPFKLQDAADNDVDLQLSGHTHHGQLWPVNLITGRIYEADYGYREKGSTHYYVSSGAGTWGPPLRVATSSEIVNIRLYFR